MDTFKELLEFAKENNNEVLKEDIRDLTKKHSKESINLFLKENNIKVRENKVKLTGYKTYIDSIPDVKLNKQEILEYFKKYKEENDEYAKNLIIECHLKLVLSIAMNYYKKGNYRMSLDELIQEGNYGLVIAMKKFNYKKGLAFSTYAVFWIKKYILKYIEESFCNHMKIPIYMVEKIKRIYKTETKYKLKYDKEISLHELSKETGIPEDMILKIKSINTCNIFSIDDKYQIELEDFHSLVPDDNVQLEKTATNNVFNEKLAKIINDMKEEGILSDKEIIVIENFFGFKGESMKLIQISREFGINRETTRLAYQTGLAKLREEIELNGYKKEDFF